MTIYNACEDKIGVDWEIHVKAKLRKYHFTSPTEVYFAPREANQEIMNNTAGFCTCVHRENMTSSALIYLQNQIQSVAR